MEAARITEKTAHLEFATWHKLKTENIMAQPDILQTILKDSNYHLDLFSNSEVQDLRQKVEGNDKPMIYCDVRRKAVQLKPEEVVRQLYAARLLKQYRYDPDRIRFEHYDNIVNAIKNCAGGYDTLENLVTLKKCVEVGSKAYIESGIPFVRVSNLSPFEITQEKYISEELYAAVEEHQPKQEEILLSKDATPGIAHYLRETPEKMIPAGGILRLKSKTDKINNEYLTLVLN